MAKTILMILVYLSAGLVPVALADYYKYTDATGAVNITNSLDSVPKRYRSQVKVITDETLSKKDQGSRKHQQLSVPVQEASSAPREEAASVPPPAPDGKFAELSARFVWFKPLVYIFGILAAFLIVIKLTSLVPSPLLSKLIIFSFFIGVFVLLYKSYTDYVVESGTAVKEKAVQMMKKSNVREIPLPDEAPPAGHK